MPFSTDPVDPIPSSPFGWPSSQEELSLSQQVIHAVIDAAFPITDPNDDDPEGNTGPQPEAQYETPTTPTPATPGSGDESGLSSPPPFDDEAEEYDSPPRDDDSSDLFSIDGDDCRSEGVRSSDSYDSAGSLAAFVRDDQVPVSSPRTSASDEEDEAVFTQQSQATVCPTTDARDELLRALLKPNGAWRPPRGDSVTPPSSPSPKRGRSDASTDDETDAENTRPSTRRRQGERDVQKPAFSKKGKGKQRRSSSPSTGRGKGKGKQRNRSPIPADGNSTARRSAPSSPGFEGPFAPLTASTVASTSALPMAAFEPQKKETAKTRVVCKWVHDDRSTEPLEPWTHGQSDASAQGYRLYQARRLSDGAVQVRFFPTQWVPTWRLNLRRPVVPPTCDGCCEEPL
ncbi:hypothetical protein CF328_g4337 [Tilletia controversa]|nr:hypothetical protein CF328_g4337 [Tilletia controversa]